MNELPRIKVPRSLVPSGDWCSFSLHVFIDASKKAYGAAVYARCSQTNGETVSNIAMSKSQVAPLKSTNIPRLELCGAVPGLNLAKSIANVLKNDMREVTFGAESMNEHFVLDP